MKRIKAIIAVIVVLVYLGIDGFGGWLRTQCMLTGSTALAPLKPPIFFLANDLRDFVVANVQMASLHNPGTPIYVITSCDQFELGRGPQLERLLSLPLVRLKLIENHLANGTDAAAFERMYWPHSLTSFQFGLFNFQRFFVVRDIAREEGLPRFWQVDFDIALFADVSELAREAPAADLVALNSFSTHFSLWTLDTLQRFCDYMLDFYTQPREQAEADIWRFGQRINQTWAQWSDMFMLHAFIETQQQDLRIKFLVQGFYDHPVMQYPVVGHYLKGHLRYLGVENLGLLLGWDCKESEFEKRIEVQRIEDRYVPVFNQTALLGLHFQGYYCKQWASKLTGRLTDAAIGTTRLIPLGAM